MDGGRNFAGPGSGSGRVEARRALGRSRPEVSTCRLLLALGQPAQRDLTRERRGRAVQGALGADHDADP